MNIEEKIKRINELYHKSQEEGLTEEEQAEQAALRAEYIANIRANLRGQLDNISIKEQDALGVPLFCRVFFHSFCSHFTEISNASILFLYGNIIQLSSQIRLKAIHFNDSMNVCGSHKDRHQKIGQGEIGMDALKAVVKHPLLKDKLGIATSAPCPT